MSNVHRDHAGDAQVSAKAIISQYIAILVLSSAISWFGGWWYLLGLLVGWQATKWYENVKIEIERSKP